MFCMLCILWARLIFLLLLLAVAEQQEIANVKEAGEALTWEDTRKMKYTWRCVQETMRLQPAVLGAFRSALQDFQYEGFNIKKGWMVREKKNP